MGTSPRTLQCRACREEEDGSGEYECGNSGKMHITPVGEEDVWSVWATWRLHAHFLTLFSDYYPPKSSLFGKCLLKKGEHCVEIEEVAEETTVEK